MTEEYKKYPLWMHHPGEQPAIISDDYANGLPRLGTSAPPGRSRMFPPVMVQNADQEAQHAAKGYLAGNSDKEAAMAAPVPLGYQYAEYPQMVEGHLVGDPNAPPPPTNEYPKWIETPVGDVLVGSAAAEAELLDRLKNGPPEEVAEVEPPAVEELMAQVAALQAQIATMAVAATEPAAEAAPMLEIDTLRSDARALGIDVDLRWRAQRLRAEIDAALSRDAA